jgi:hypothetical protein
VSTVCPRGASGRTLFYTFPHIYRRFVVDVAKKNRATSAQQSKQYGVNVNNADTRTIMALHLLNGTWTLLRDTPLNLKCPLGRTPAVYLCSTIANFSHDKYEWTPNNISNYKLKEDPMDMARHHYVHGGFLRQTSLRNVDVLYTEVFEPCLCN